MQNFENRLINGVHATRYIRSWQKAGGEMGYPLQRSRFWKWLESMDICEEDIMLILHLAGNGKLELERSAKAFLEENTNIEGFGEEA